MNNREYRLVKNTAILTLGKVCTQCIGFFMIPLYTTLLSPEDYGIADLITTYISVVVPLISLQTDQGLFRIMLDHRNDENHKNACLTSTLYCNLIQICIFWLLYTIFQVFVTIDYKIYIAILVPLNLVLAILLQYSRGVDKTSEYSIGSFLFATAQVILNVIFIAVIRIGAEGLFYSMIGANFIAITYLVIRLQIWKHCSWRYFSKKVYTEIIKYSLPLIPNIMAWWVINASDRLIIAHSIGTYYNGLYSIANKFSTVFITVYNYFNMSWTESVTLCFAEDDRDIFLSRMINKVSNILFCICAGIIVCMPFIFKFMVNEQYSEAYYQIPILMYAVLFQALQGLYSAVYVALKKSSELAKTSLFAAIINLSVNILLINKIGLYAASISTLVAFLAMTIYRYIDLKKYVFAPLHKRNIVIYIVLSICVIEAYYSYVIVQAVVFMIIFLYSVISNKDLLVCIYSFVRKK